MRAALAFALLLCLAPVAGAAEYDPDYVAPSPEVAAILRSVVPTQCCVTNSCCVEVSGDEMQYLGGESYRIIATGEVIQKTGWSPTGKPIRCSYEYVQDRGVFVCGPKRPTKCLLPAAPGS